MRPDLCLMFIDTLHQGFVVDARLSHFAIGIQMAERLRQANL